MTRLLQSESNPQRGSCFRTGPLHVPHCHRGGAHRPGTTTPEPEFTVASKLNREVAAPEPAGPELLDEEPVAGRAGAAAAAPNNPIAAHDTRHG